MFLESLHQDVSLGLRVLWKDKAFLLLATLVLALGICGVTTQFTIVNAFLLRGFSFPHPEQLVNLGFLDPKATLEQNNGGRGNIPGTQDYIEICETQQSYSELAAFLNGSTINVTYKNNPQRYTGGYVTDNLFKLVGVAPILGRDFTPQDNKPGAEKVTLLSYELWQRDFGGDPHIVGEHIKVNGNPATIIGVMPKGFKFPIAEQLWVTYFNQYPVKPRGDRADNNPQVIGRLKSGVSIAQANAELNGIARRFAAAYPKTNGQLTAATVQPLLSSFLDPGLRGTLLAMLGAVLVVLLIACVNVMNMQFGRGAARAKELAIRGALGASRMRLLRQMLTETLIVAVIGTATGVGLSFWTVGLISSAVNALPFPLPYWVSFDIDGTVLAFTVGATLLATAVSGLLPAWLSARGNTAELMKEGGRGNSSRLVAAITRMLVVGQIALTAALLVISTLQIKSIRNQLNLNYGYVEDAVYAARMALMEGAYPSNEARREFFIRLLRGLRETPDFAKAALTSRFRMTFDFFGQFEVDGQPYVTDRDRPRTNVEAISDDYFGTLGLRVINGRDFTLDDVDSKQPVAIVNTSFARKWFGNDNPIGKRIRVFLPAQPDEWRTIVGVAPDMLMQGPFNQQTDSAGFYIPLLGANPSAQFCTIVVRPRAGVRADTLGPLLGQMVARFDSNLPLYFGATPARLHSEQLGGNRIIATLFTLFGAVGVVLAAVGLYGVMSFSVNQRTQEFGIRMALGADARRILRLVMRQGAWQLGIGMVIGGGAIALLLHAAGTEALQNFLFKVNALDPSIYGSVATLLAIVAAISCFIPARRATRVNPIVALRAE